MLQQVIRPANQSNTGLWWASQREPRTPGEEDEWMDYFMVVTGMRVKGAVQLVTWWGFYHPNPRCLGLRRVFLWDDVSQKSKINTQIHSALKSLKSAYASFQFRTHLILHCWIKQNILIWTCNSTWAQEQKAITVWSVAIWRHGLRAAALGMKQW